MPNKDIEQKLASMERRMNLLEKTLAIVAPRRLLNAKEAAAFLGMTMDGLYGLTCNKAIPFYKPTGKRLYFDMDELAAWQKKNPVKQARKRQSLKASPAAGKGLAGARSVLVFEYPPKKEKTEQSVSD